MNFTDEQHAAIHTHDRPLIVTAGAGSGKTRVLVERFMALLDARPDWSLPSIVAITFTEKAAREMRDRVRVAIEDRIRAAVAAGDDAALEGWLDHQAALTRARIGTIHALCASLLRANPAESGLDPAFEVLDENEAAILLDDAVDEALALIANDLRPATQLLGGYGLGTVRAALRHFAAQSLPADAIQDMTLTADLWFERWQSTWETMIRDLMADARADTDLRVALDVARPGDLLPSDRLSDIWRQVHAHTDALLAGTPAEFAEAVGALASGIKVNVGVAANWGGKAILEESRAALKLIRERLRASKAMLLPPPGDPDQQAISWFAPWQDAIALATGVYQQRKRERNALDFDDLETRARSLLIEHPTVVARYVNGEFNHVLVDEFQDTNAAQRDIITALAGIDQPGAGGRLFVVGDPKQSIYAFRGADVSVFGAVRDDLRARGGAELPLSTSFRTHHNLVAALNDLFGRILTPGAASYEVDLGAPMTAFRPSDLEAHVQPLTVFAFPRPDKAAYPDFGADDLRRWEARALAGHLHAMVADGTPVWDRGRGAYRPMDYGDVALLFQSMTRAPLYEDEFKTMGLPYVTVAGKGYFDRQEVWDLLNLLRALHDPADDLALAVALRSPLFGLSDDALLSLRLAQGADGDPLPFWEALMGRRTPYFPDGDLEARDFARDVLTDLRDLAGRATIAELLARALDRTGYLATLTGLADGARRRGNVEKLVALARESGRVALGAFNAYARDLTAREVREGEAAIEVEGAVTLMSVHASKGLEFPVVVLADASWTRRRRDSEVFLLDPEIGPACRLPSDDPDAEIAQPFAWEYAALLRERRDRAERRRLLYVGATRAQDYLIMSGSLRSGADQAWLRQWLDALGVDTDALEPSDDPYLLRYDWGDCALHVPQTVPADLGLPRAAAQTVSAWDDPAIQAGEPVAGIDPALPPLLDEIPADPTAPARALTATQLARLGRVPYYDPTARGRAAFRDLVLHDAPEPLRPLPDRAAGEWALRRLVGEIAHRALRFWMLPDNTPQPGLGERLRIYAWDVGLSDDSQIETAVTAALDLLRKFEESPVRADLERASQVYRELPFAYRTGERTMHGVIDVVFFDGRAWHVMDYKTAPVSSGGAHENAKRHYLQVGVYARAVEAKTGQVPQTRLYYIHPGRLVFVKPDDWGAALARLEDDLQDALEIGR